MHWQHYSGPTTEDQLVVASSSGKQHQWERGFEAHQASCLHQPNMFANDLCRSDNSGITLQGNAFVPVRMLRVGHYIHMGERLL